MKNIYLKHPLFNYFNEQIIKLSNDDLFFEGIFLGNKKIKIFFNESMDEWLSIYKEELSKISLSFMKKKNTL